MSFQNQSFLMAKGTECPNDGEMNYDNSSRIDPKHSHLWSMDGPEAEFFPNKKQAVEVPNNNFFTGLLNSDASPWGHVPGFHTFSGQLTERFFDSETPSTDNFEDRNIPPVSTGKISMEGKTINDLFVGDSSFGLSISQKVDDPRSGFNHGGIRKVKVSQVKDSENVMPVAMGHAYCRLDSDTISGTDAYDKGDESSISMGLAYDKGNDNMMPTGDSCDRGNNFFVKLFNKGNENISIGPMYKENDSNIGKIAIGQAFSRDDSNIMSIRQTYCQADDDSISTRHIHNKVDTGSLSMDHTYNKGDSNNLVIGHTYSEGEGTIISFGGYDDNTDNTYELLVGQPSIQRSETVNENESTKSNAEAMASAAHVTASGAETFSKKKEDLKASKKVPPNNFPSNVRSLLSTGMLDGVPVKYIVWSREKELRGVIKGSGYLCGCQSCNFSKVINAYEFERHAGCKTKHPNNHIYFENGKTVYGVVQELRSTPQDMLFEVIQTITGSPINQKSFRLWKESFLAATRELQRIYGKDEGKQFS
ncbi:uncharacterized protein LOC119999058 isoform X1 [Tripterygium wilfordii]|uniref:uncharacterized protein LOC119999058 isoform X1 n=1 Tax=Tripterygium wilfordii TaxID=458696 RepID=UPI0018F83BCF|nr:uncharacterized protein LOC119999058 isoform X1 [Tripterygium wilfordii]XP_038702489.1 uncharacterized protein LOC119999058 isoform X1 [Tripterygium wilfordii]